MMEIGALLPTAARCGDRALPVVICPHSLALVMMGDFSLAARLKSGQFLLQPPDFRLQFFRHPVLYLIDKIN